MANIKTLLDTIKNAIYGSDMRLALHDSIDIVNTEVALKQNEWRAETTGTSTAYTAVLDPAPTALYVGMKVTIIPHVTSTSKNATLNVNGLGAKEIRQRSSNTNIVLLAEAADFLVAGKPAGLLYDGNYWVMTEFSRPAWWDIRSKPDLLQPSNVKAGENVSVSVSGTDVTISAEKTAVADNLTSASATTALSAKQGKVLNEKITTVQEEADGKLDASDLVAGDNVDIAVSDGKVTISAAGGNGGSGGVTIVDNLESTSKISALSANQGRVLDEKIDKIVTKVYTELPKTWQDVQDIVRAGRAKDIFSVGEQFAVLKYLNSYSAHNVITSTTNLNTWSPPDYDGRYGSYFYTIVDVNKFVNNFPHLCGTRYDFEYDGVHWRCTNEDGETVIVDIPSSEYGISIEYGPTLYYEDDPYDEEGNPKYSDWTIQAGDGFTLILEAIELIFDIIGIDEDTPADENYTHSLTLQTHEVFPYELSFDTPEAMWYFDESDYQVEIPYGDFIFAIEGDAYEDGDKTYPSMENGYVYTFNLPAPMSSSGGIQLVLSSDKKTVGVYYAFDSEAAYECEVTCLGHYYECLDDLESSKYCRLPDIAYPHEGESWYGTSPNWSDGDLGKKVNHPHRAGYGSGEWLYSDIRQWLNSDAAIPFTTSEATGWWTPQNNFDRPTIMNRNGFLYNLEPDFKNILGEVKNKITSVSGFNAEHANTYHNDADYTYESAANEDYSYYDDLYFARSTEKVFIPDKYELHGDSGWTDASGFPSIVYDLSSHVYSYYNTWDDDYAYEFGSDGAQIERVKCKSGTATEWCTRSGREAESPAFIVAVREDGSLADGICSGWKFFTPVCVIV